MIIRRSCPVTGEWKEMDLPVTEEQMHRYNSGELAQRVFPHLSADEREFIISGATADIWDEMFPETEE